MSAEALRPEDPDIIVRPMLTMNRAIDLYAGDLSRRGCSERTRYTYTRILGLFADRLPDGLDVSRITADDCRLFLDLYNRRAAGTRAHTYAVMSAFFGWLVQTESVKRSPLATVSRPRRQRAEDLDVTTVTADDVRRLLAAGQTWTEKLAVAIPAYLGPRRTAVARLRLRDYDRARSRLRFQEKGGKTIWKPIPDELVNLLEAAIDDGAIRDPDDYLVPPEGTLVRPGDRDDRIIWRVVKRVAARAGIVTHVHALRAAFAVLYLEQHPGDAYAVQKLLGHVNPATTEVYLRKLDTEAVMDPVRRLSWAEDLIPAEETAHVRREAGLSRIQGSGVSVESSAERVGGDQDSERLVARVVELESRLAAAEAANLALATSDVVGAGGFEPPYPDSPHGSDGCGQHLVGDLVDEARSASEVATPKGVS